MLQEIEISEYVIQQCEEHRKNNLEIDKNSCFYADYERYCSLYGDAPIDDFNSEKLRSWSEARVAKVYPFLGKL